MDAALGEMRPGTYAVADLLELRYLLESIRDDRCPVDRDALESLLAKF